MSNLRRKRSQTKLTTSVLKQDPKNIDFNRTTKKAYASIPAFVEATDE